MVKAREQPFKFWSRSESHKKFLTLINSLRWLNKFHTSYSRVDGCEVQFGSDKTLPNVEM